MGRCTIFQNQVIPVGIFNELHAINIEDLIQGKPCLSQPMKDRLALLKGKIENFGTQMEWSRSTSKWTNTSLSEAALSCDTTEQMFRCFLKGWPDGDGKALLVILFNDMIREAEDPMAVRIGSSYNSKPVDFKYAICIFSVPATVVGKCGLTKGLMYTAIWKGENSF